jgi:hypothetical protein
MRLLNLHLINKFKDSLVADKFHHTKTTDTKELHNNNIKQLQQHPPISLMEILIIKDKDFKDNQL